MEGEAEMSEWVKVSDHLPPYNKKLLVYGVLECENEPDIYKATRCMVHVRDGDKQVKIEDQYWEVEWCYDITEVTHWMLLPEAPHE